jgi:type VI secretion system protein VasD
MKIFELSSRAIFDTQDFFSLYDNPEQLLGPDLLKKDELELQPSTIQNYKMSLNRNTRYVGVVVAYRNIDQAKWRAVIEVDPTGYDDIDVNVEAIATYMREK